jgi:hypothetical protein
MLSTLELRHLIESAFLPLSCECRVDQGGSLQIKIFEPVSGYVEVVVTGIPIAQLNSCQAIAKLIEDIRGEIKEVQERVRNT